MSTDAAVRGRYHTGVRRREEILDAAVKVFSSRGYVGSTMKQVADEVGVTPAAVLRYFTKDQLLTEVLQHWDQNQYRIPDTLRGLDFFRGFRDLMLYHVKNRWLLELFLVFATESADTSHPAHDFMTKRYRTILDGIQREIFYASERGQIRLMPDAERLREAHFLVAALDGLEIQFLLLEGIDLPALVSQCVEDRIASWQVPVGDQIVGVHRG